MKILSTDLILLVIILSVIGFALYKKVDVFETFIKGAKEGLCSVCSILPSLCFLMTAIGMIKSSGILESFTAATESFWAALGFPPQVLPLALLRPFSGSGALAFYEELCETLPVNSFAERVASVLMGGSETTFYTLAVYYGAVNIKNTKNSLFAALFADFAAAVLSLLAVNLLFGQK